MTSKNPFSILASIFSRLAVSGTLNDLENLPYSHSIFEYFIPSPFFLTLSPEIVDFIAKRIETNVRDLEAALNKVFGYAELVGKTPDLNIAKNLLKDIMESNSIENISLDVIQKVIADNYQISVSDLKGKKRDKKFVIPRQIAIYISRELTEISYTELGNEFGGKDHSTIMTAYKKIADQIKVDSTLESKIQLYIREIKEYKK